jgi:hypothetical protein
MSTSSDGIQAGLPAYLLNQKYISALIKNIEKSDDLPVLPVQETGLDNFIYAQYYICNILYNINPIGQL